MYDGLKKEGLTIHIYIRSFDDQQCGNLACYRVVRHNTEVYITIIFVMVRTGEKKIKYEKKEWERRGENKEVYVYIVGKAYLHIAMLTEHE